MRAFEVVLIFTNLSTLLLGFRQPSRGAWWGAAGANLTIFAIHAIFEGLRYQLAFAYLFVILLLAYVLVSTWVRSAEIIIPGWLEGLGLGVCLVLLGTSAFLAYALPVFRLAPPSGIDAVGIRYFHLVDEKRNDPFLDRTTKKRELMVKVYYPAEEDGSKAYAPYFNGSVELIRLMTTGYGLPAFTFDHLSLVELHSKPGLELSDRATSYPVILYSHGAGTSMEVHASQCEDLASHGYIVVAIDHTYTSAGTVFPDRIVSAREATTDFNTVDPAETITQIMADDVRFVIDQLSELNVGEIDSAFKDRLDMEKVGVMGHSVGGAVAYNLAINEPRIKAAIDLDGIVFVTPKGDPDGMAPFLMLANDRYHVQAIQKRESLTQRFEDMSPVDQKITRAIYGSEQAYQAAYDKSQRNVAGLVDVLKVSGNLYTIQGSDHMKLTDIGLYIGNRRLREAMQIGGETDPMRCLEITQALTAAFFDQILKGESSETMGGLMRRYPELRRVDLE